MSSGDVTIPRETAQAYVRQVRAVAARLPLSETGKMLSALADLLDPPQRSLRDEVIDALTIRPDGPTSTGEAADAVLAVVRKHYRERAEGLLFWSSTGNPVMDRRDVLAMFGGDDE